MSVEIATLGDRGLEMDRLWMVVDGNGRFLSQRRCAKMALIASCLPRTKDEVNKEAASLVHDFLVVFLANFGRRYPFRERDLHGMDVIVPLFCFIPFHWSVCFLRSSVTEQDASTPLNPVPACHFYLAYGLTLRPFVDFGRIVLSRAL